MSSHKGYNVTYQMNGSPGVIKEKVYTNDYTAAKRSIEGRGGRVLSYNPIFE
jgi:nitrous oxide reductase accessory protein NosL